MSKKYEVGYGRPPKDRQFKKGVSGNPNGRPRKKQPEAKSVEKLILEIGEEKHELNGKIYTTNELIARTVASKAAKGDARAIAQYVELQKRASQTEMKPLERGGVLVVPGPMDMDAWSAAAAAQQAKFRGKDPEGLERLSSSAGLDIGLLENETTED